ncbi:MAG: hypothetical protein A2342_02185 [Gallionellales bacterium RIFOXYB12_FULL_54_9]|nr:MAG: hypothetical protein A2342_02185 [Gallionellales bacterium RIFOXYB12_FULL_54_9]
MAKQASEDEQNIKRKARRRLVGAVVLALATVVILPMVLDSEPKPTAQDIDLRIPASDKAGEFVSGAVLSEVVEASVESVAIQSETMPAPVVHSEVIADSAKPVEAKRTEVKQVEVKPAVVKPVEAKPVEVKAPAAKVADKPVGTFIVQIGAFSNADTAIAEADKLKAAGFKVYTEQINGTMRVRMGPYKTRDAADEIRAQLEKRGQHPAVSEVNGHGK